MKNQIICVSSANWYPFPTRKHQIMSRLKDAEVLYFDPPVTLIAPLKDKDAWGRLTAWLKKPQKPQENITVYAVPPVLPFYNKQRWINRINQWMLGRFMNGKIKKHGFTAALLWCYMPQSADLAGQIAKIGLVYDCVDRHSAYPGMINPDVVDKMEKDLAHVADAVFSTALGLHERLSAYHESAVLIPNGANFTLFHKAAAPYAPEPPELADIDGPIIGFVGMLQECIDYDLIETILRERPAYTVVFIGKPLPGVNIERLQAYPNARFLGLKPQEELPWYMAQFDVCLNTFVKGDLSKDVSPLKFYEYLATGKPIVTTPQPLQVMDYKDVIYVAANGEEILRQCDAAVKEDDEALRQKRIEYGLRCSWDSRVAQMEAILKEKNLLA